MRLSKRTKIVATVGPACHTDEALSLLIAAGVDVFRINTSHSGPDDTRDFFERIRRVSAQAGEPTGILVDLQGPKIRIGEMEGGAVELKQRAHVTVTTEPGVGNADLLHTDYAGFASDVDVGDVLLLDDGLIRVRAVEKDDARVTFEVEVGGVLKSHKGMSLKGKEFSADSLSDKDVANLELACELDADFVAVSFVRRASDVTYAKDIIRLHHKSIHVVSKIEQSSALANFDEILSASDAVMVARGDLGIETPLEEVPIHQKRIIRACNAAAKPVITATQMLESMIEHPMPTRAEVSDVANAILDGTDAVMLSAETSTGKYPVEAVSVMASVARTAEAELHEQAYYTAPEVGRARSIADAVTEAACEVASMLRPVAIVAPTATGYSARMISRYKPRPPVIAPTHDERVMRRLNLSFGVFPVLFADLLDPSADVAGKVKAYLPQAKSGDALVFVGGLPAGVGGITNFIKVEKIK
jgi:pyruvate kinase